MESRFAACLNGLLQQNQHNAEQLERKHVALLAAIAEDILGERIAFVDIITRGADRFTI